MDKSHLNGLVALFALLFSPLCTLGALPERTELFTRTYNGTYNVTSTVESVITGVGRVNLLICVPYPESNRYQDIVWQKAIPANLISYYSETGRPFIKFAKYEPLQMATDTKKLTTGFWNKKMRFARNAEVMIWNISRVLIAQ